MAYQAIAFPVFQPAMRIITSITNAVQPEVTTSFPHQYFTGTIVRLYIPDGFGMIQANKLQGTITVTGDTTFIMNTSTYGFDAFVIASTFPFNQQQASCVPIGEENSTLQAATKNTLPYSM